MNASSRQTVRDSLSVLMDAKRNKKRILIFKKGDDIGIECKISKIIVTDKDVHLQVFKPHGEELAIGGGTLFQVI